MFFLSFDHVRHLTLQPDKVSLLGDAIEYVKDLQRRLEELESNRNKVEKVSVKQYVEVTVEKRMAILKISCAWQDGLLIDILQKMTGLQLEVVDATAKASNGVLKATLKAKVSTDIISSFFKFYLRTLVKLLLLFFVKELMIIV